MIDRALKERWLNRLEDPATKKGTGHLEYNGGLCCLGVLCEVLGLEKKTFEKVSRYSFKGIRFSSNLSLDLLFDLKITLEQQEVLIQLNDDNKTFDKVIDYIEREL